MAKDSRTLKLSILADIDDLKKKLKDADGAVEENSNKIGEFSKKVGKAFLVAGAAAAAYAGKLLYDGVKAAIEDEKANAKLAATLINVAGATQKTINQVLAYSRATELATGVTEDELRPSLNRLTIATKDAGEAIRLQQIALDVAAGSGKSLDAVTQALSKAYEGNSASLVRLGIGLSAAELKTMSFDEITQRLSGTFAGQADIAANTFGVRIERLKLAFEDVRDSLAERLLPFLEKLADFLLIKGVPALQAFVAGLTGEQGALTSIDNATQGAYRFGEQIRSTAKFVISIKDELILLGGIIATVFVANKIVLFVTAIGTLITAMKALRTAAAGAAVATAFATGGTSVGAAALALTAVAATYGLSQFARGADETGAGGSAFQYGAGNPQFGLPTGGGAGGGASGGFTGGGGFAGGGAGGGAGSGAGGGGAISTQAATSLKDLADKLLNVQDRFSDLTFQVASGGISKSAAQKQFDALQAQFRVLEKQGQTLAANPNIVINVSGAIDPEGTARAVANQLNSQAARSVTALRDRVN